MHQLTCATLLLATLGLAHPGSPQDKPGLLLIDKEGQVERIKLDGLELLDPRQRNAWSVRPVGFPEPPPLGTDGTLQSLLVRLANGDSLRGKLAPSEGETLNLRLLGDVELPILIDHIIRIDIGEPAQAARPLALEAPKEGDRLYQRTSQELDAIDGTFDSFVPEGIRFESTALGLKTFAWDQVAALMIEDLGLGEDAGSEPGLPMILDLRAGGRLRGQLSRLDEEGCHLEVAGQELFFAWSALEELIVDDGSLLFLSDLPALKEEGRGQIFGDDFEVVWPHVPNGCVWRGGPLRCAGQVFRRGIGTHAPTKVTWAVPEGTRFLRGLVGIDDTSLYNEPEYRGSVIFRVHVDGQQVWQSRLVSGGAAPLAMPSIDLQGAKQVTLEADMAGSFEGDRANWLEMVFVR